MTDQEKYEMHARSNEDLRNCMDGVLEENPNVHSQEKKDCNGECENCACEQIRG